MTDGVDYHVLPLFAIPLYSSYVEHTTSTDLISKLQYERMGSNRGSISENKFILDDDKFKCLKIKIKEHVSFFLKKFLHLDNQYTIEIKKSWAVKHFKGDSAHRHDHKNSLFSGIVYLKCDDNSGDIIFYKDSNYCNLFPTMLTPSFTDYNVCNSTEWRCTPKPNQIFLFPSHLSHSVTESKSNNERICLAFNIVVRGNYGNENESTALEYLNL